MAQIKLIAKVYKDIFVVAKKLKHIPYTHEQSESRYKIDEGIKSGIVVLFVISIKVSNTQ